MNLSDLTVPPSYRKQSLAAIAKVNDKVSRPVWETPLQLVTKKSGSTIKIVLQCSKKDFTSTEYLTTRIGNLVVTSLPSGCFITYYD